MKKDIYKLIHFAVPQKLIRYKTTQSANQHNSTNQVYFNFLKTSTQSNGQHSTNGDMLSALSRRPRSVTPPQPLTPWTHSTPQPVSGPSLPSQTTALSPYTWSHLAPDPPPQPPESRPHSTQCIFLLKLHKIYSSCNYNVENENAEVQRGPLNASTWLSSLSSCPRSTPHCLWNSQLSTHPSPGSSEHRPSPSHLPPPVPMMGPDQDPACSLNIHSTPQAPPSLPVQRLHLSREDYFGPEGRASCLAPDLL